MKQRTKTTRAEFLATAARIEKNRRAQAHQMEEMGAFGIAAIMRAQTGSHKLQARAYLRDHPEAVSDAPKPRKRRA